MRKLLLLMYALPTLMAIGQADAIELMEIDIHGFVSQGFLISTDNNTLSADTEDGTFQFNELGINFGKELTDNLALGIQIFSRDMGKIGNNDVVIDWAYGDYRFRDWLGLRAGIMRITHGFYNETRDIDMLRTAILLPQSVYPENTRDFFSRIQGAGIYGDILMGRGGSLSYQLMAGTLNIDEDGGVARGIESVGIFEVTDFDEGLVYNAGLQWHTPLTGLRIGLTGLKMTDLETETKTTVPMGPFLPAGTKLINELDNFWAYVFSLEYVWNDFVFSTEYFEMKIEDSVRDFPFEHKQHSFGCYGSISYGITDWMVIGAYHSVHFPDKDDKDGDKFVAQGEPDYRAWQKDYALSLRFDINEYCTLKLEGHRMDGAAQLYDEDNPDGFDEDWYLFAAKMSFNF